MKAEYKHISIPKKLVDAIDKYIEEHPELDLRSRAQVVNFALRFLFTRDKMNKVNMEMD